MANVIYFSAFTQFQCLKTIYFVTKISCSICDRWDYFKWLSLLVFTFAMIVWALLDLLTLGPSM